MWWKKSGKSSVKAGDLTAFIDEGSEIDGQCMFGGTVMLNGMIRGAIAAALVMLIVGFFFATVSGYLVGVIGSSNNPISGLTLSTLVIAALLMVSIGVQGTSGVIAVLAVAAVVCVSSAVAGELLQDFKVGYILGGTPRTIQIAELILARRPVPA